jgi:KUP system potassium uptake protein
MRADNSGEGGILALTALTLRYWKADRKKVWWLVVLGIFGAALFYGDGIITPAISVLSAVEGLEIVSDMFKPYIIPSTIIILIGLFAVQRKGTASVGALFGPIMCVWFTVLAVLGFMAIIQQPIVLKSIIPYYAIEFLIHNKYQAFLVLGSVVLVMTGAEALYADMGHFGKRPIQQAWFYLVGPAILINYFGQGALLISRPETVTNPFYLLAPDWALVPLVILATAATVIASQAVISGAFSLTRQAIQLGFCPRMEIDHTSEEEVGQIYVPWINWVLLVAIIGLVLGFESSSNLAAAYGIAVTGTMVITTLFAFVAMKHMWKWGAWGTWTAIIGFLSVDLVFFSANAIKIPQGGWFPIVVGIGIFTLMSTWKRGRELIAERMKPDLLEIDDFLMMIDPRNSSPSNSLFRVPGTAVFMTSHQIGVPPALLHNLKHNKVVHERIVLLTLVVEDLPYIKDHDRVRVQDLGSNFFRVVAQYGFKEDPNVPKILESCHPYGLDFNEMETTFFLGRETLIPSKDKAKKRFSMAPWREKLFISMLRNSRSATDFFRIPSNRVIEIGTQLNL